MIDKEKTMIRINIEKLKLRNYLDDTCYDTLNQKSGSIRIIFLIPYQMNMIIFN